MDAAGDTPFGCQLFGGLSLRLLSAAPPMTSCSERAARCLLGMAVGDRYEHRRPGFRLEVGAAPRRTAAVICRPYRG